MQIASVVLCVASMLTGVACAASPVVRPAGTPSGEALQDAVAEGKIGAPVRVQYQLMGALIPNQPVALRLSVTPKVAGERLLLEVPDAAGYRDLKESRTLVAGKASSGIATETTVMLTPMVAVAADLRVLVSYDVEGARYFSVYRVPLGTRPAATPARKQSPERQPIQQ